MAFNSTYQESIQDKHVGNVGFTSIAKGVLNEANAAKNPHSVDASQIPTINVVETYGVLTASGIAAGVVEEHTVKLTADPTVNNNLNWLAYETDCTTAGHSVRGAVKLDQFIRVAGTQYKLQLYEDNGAGTAPGTEIFDTETNFNWDYNQSAGTVYMDADPNSSKTIPLWGKFYTYIGESVADKFDTTSSGLAATDVFKNLTDGTNTAVAVGGSDTFQFIVAGGLTVEVSSSANTLTITPPDVSEAFNRDLSWVSGEMWGYAGGFASMPDNLLVYMNGVLQKNDPEYYTATVVSGTGELRVTFGFNTHGTGAEPDWAAVTYGEIYAGAYGPWMLKVANYSANIRDKVMLNTTTSGGSNNTEYTIELPANPIQGDFVGFFDAANNCGTTKVIVDRNGNRINGIQDNLDIDSDGASFDLVYLDDTLGWRIKN